MRGFYSKYIVYVGSQERFRSLDYGEAVQKAEELARAEGRTAEVHLNNPYYGPIHTAKAG